MRFAPLVILGTFLMAGCSNQPPAPAPTPAPATPPAATNSQGQSSRSSADATAAAATTADRPQVDKPAEPTPVTKAGGAAARPALPPVSPRVRAGLVAARQTMDTVGINEPAFARAFAPIAAELPEAKVSSGDEPVVWNKLTIGAQGAKLGAFRFRSPLDQPGDLLWTFAVPQGFQSWFILPVEGTMSGFEEYSIDWDLDFAGSGFARGEQSYFQPLWGGQILPGKDYIIWFARQQTTPFEIQAALRVEPSGGRVKTGIDVALALGLERKYHEFPKTDAGIGEAMALAYRMLDSGRAYRAESLQRLLRSVGDQLPQMRLSKNDGKPIWNPVAPPASAPFYAVRFTTTGDAPSDLQAMYVFPPERPNWYILPADGPTWEAQPYRFEVDLPFEEPALPKQNLVVLQKIAGGHFQPGQDYFLCFMPVAGKLSDFHLAATLTPPARAERNPLSREIAGSFGLAIPEVPSPARVEAALRRLGENLNSRHYDDSESQHLLESVADGLPVLEVSESGALWNKVESPKSNLSYAAYRFKSPLKVPGDATIAIVKPPELTLRWWGLRDMSSGGQRKPLNHVANNVAWEGTNFSRPNDATFFATTGGWAAPDGWCLVHLSFGGATSVPLSIAVHVAPEGTFPPTRSTAMLAKRFELKNPAAKSSGETVIKAHSDAVTGLVVLPDGSRMITGSSDGKVRLWNGMTGEAAGELPETEGPVRTVSLNSEGTHLAVVRENQVQVWNLDEKKVEQTVRVPGGPSDAALSGDHRWLAVCDDSRDVSGAFQARYSSYALFDMRVPGRPAAFQSQTGDGFRAVELSADGRSVIYAGLRNKDTGRSGILRMGLIQFLDRQTMKVEEEFYDEIGEWRDLALSADGRRLAGCKENVLIRVWELPSRKTIASVAQDSRLVSIGISADGSQVATGSADGSVRLWDGETLRLKRLWRGHEEDVLRCAFVPGAPHVASAGIDGTLRLWKNDEAQTPGDTGPMTDSLGFRLMPIPAGEFEMGLPEDYKWSRGDVEAEQPRHRVRITRPFRIASRETTVAQFRAFVETTGHVTSAEKSAQGGRHATPGDRPRGAAKFSSSRDFNWKNPGYPQEDDFPVVQVSWQDATAFCEWLSTRENARYRLPTEAEWEYACRASSPTVASFGEYPRYTWWCANVEDTTSLSAFSHPPGDGLLSDGFVHASPVGSLLPNAWGLFDMHGNAAEWCSDWYDAAYYKNSPADDPQGASAGIDRVLRGGSWFSIFAYCRSSARDFGAPAGSTSQWGFRVVRELP